jgi:DNA-binding GntR family transcriptional regulator
MVQMEFRGANKSLGCTDDLTGGSGMILEPSLTRPQRGKKRSLAAEIAQAIRSGVLRPGEWLRQIDLEERFGATRFDVRAALAELALRQTVEHVPNRGYRVAVPDRRRVHELLEVRALLEVEAALTALPYIGNADLLRLEALATAFDQAIMHAGMVEHSSTNEAFHQAIYEHTPNRVLVELVLELRDRSRLSPVTLWPSHSALLRSAGGHHRTIAAIRAGDRDMLASTMAEHVLGSEANYSNDPLLPVSGGEPTG